MKNIVFDFGQVLVRFEPSYMVGQYVSCPDDAGLLAEVVFDRAYWDPLDAGTVSDEAVLAACHTRLPQRLWNVADKIYYNWIYNLPEIPGMRDLIGYVKEKYGVPVFLLSNISRYFAAHAGEIPILSLIDRCVFSSVCGMVKPDPAIYGYLCRECGILPQETLFVDDRAENIAGAQSAGLAGYLFDGNAEKLRKYLDGVLEFWMK